MPAPFEGRMFDCGSKEGFIQANVAFALARDDIRDLVFEPIEAMIASQERAQRGGLIDREHERRHGSESSRG